MKKYRCPWYVSTRNHNILYFVCIRRTSLLNKGTYLWKAPKALDLCGSELSKSALNLMQRHPLPVSPLRPISTFKASPGPHPVQDAD
jgi:hypothetical protein